MTLWGFQIGSLWWFAEPLLLLAGQPADVAALAASYTRLSLPCLPAFALFEASRRFLQVQGVVTPMLWVSAGVNAVHPLLNWALIGGCGGSCGSGMGFNGAPVATVLSQWLLALGLAALMAARKPHDTRTWTGLSKEALSWNGLVEYLKLGVPGGEVNLL